MELIRRHYECIFPRIPQTVVLLKFKALKVFYILRFR